MAVVVIPAYRPDEVLVKLVSELGVYGCRTVVVDDGSGSEYEKIFSEISDKCTVLHHPENRGKGAAIKTALEYIGNETDGEQFIGIMDADGQHLPEDMIRLIDFAGNHSNALALGVRSVGMKMPWKSRMGNRITRTVFHMLSGVEVSDTQTGLRAFSSELIPLMCSVKGERYEYEMNVLIAMADAGIPIEEMPISTIYRDEQNSTSHFRAVRDSFRIYRDMLKFSMSSFSSFILDYLLFTVLTLILPHVGTAVIFANITARVVSAMYNYAMNCRFVFHTKCRVRTAADYFTLAGAILVMNNIILGMLVQIMHVPVYPAKLITECILFAVSWLVQNKFIFSRKRRLQFRIEKEVRP